jgi:hypothetical protein
VGEGAHQLVNRHLPSQDNQWQRPDLGGRIRF